MYWVILVIVLAALMFWWRSPQFPLETLVYRFAFVAMLSYLAGFLDSRRAGNNDDVYGSIVNQPEEENAKEFETAKD